MAVTETRTGYCLCGCNRMARHRYRPGHDAKHVSKLVARIMASDDAHKLRIFESEVAELSPALQDKLYQTLQTAEAREFAARYRSNQPRRRYVARTRQAA